MIEFLFHKNFDESILKVCYNVREVRLAISVQKGNGFLCRKFIELKVIPDFIHNCANKSIHSVLTLGLATESEVGNEGVPEEDDRLVDCWLVLCFYDFKINLLTLPHSCLTKYYKEIKKCYHLILSSNEIICYIYSLSGKFKFLLFSISPFC